MYLAKTYFNAMDCMLNECKPLFLSVQNKRATHTLHFINYIVAFKMVHIMDRTMSFLPLIHMLKFYLQNLRI